MTWSLLSQAERDAAYNNGAAVADASTLNAARRAASTVYRAEHATLLDQPYAAGERQKWDIYPAADPAAPCLVFIHGGYWQMNGREDFASLAQGVAAHGFAVAMPGYTLAPQASMSEIVAEIFMALDWLAGHRKASGLGGKVIVSGWSAGAQLAALALGHDLITAGLAISGVYELGPLRDTYLNEKLRLTDAEIEAFSPLRCQPVDKPLMVAYGTAELPALVADSENLAALREKANVPTFLEPIAGADHFTILHELTKPDGILTKQVINLSER